MLRGTATFLLLILLAAAFAGCVQDAPKKDTQGEQNKKRLGGKVESVFEGVYKFDGSYSYTLVNGTLGFHKDSPFSKGLLVELASTVTGTVPPGKVTIGLWRPDVPEGTKVPVIVDAGPYYGELDVVATSPANRLGKFLIENFVPHGYAVAQVPVRGTGNNAGCMDFFGQGEQADLVTAINWLGTQPWSNGNVAMIGRSYDGSTPWEVAATGNKHLKTIVPISGLSDIFGLMTYNGTSESRHLIMHPVVYWPFGFSSDGRSTENQVANLVCPEMARGIVSGALATLTGTRGPEAFDYAHIRDFEKHTRAKWKGSVFMIHGLQDWNVEPHMAIPLADQMEREGYVVKQLYGQWGHMYPDRKSEHTQGNNPPPCGAKNTRYDWAEIMLHWFDRELKGLNVTTGPAVQVLDQISCRWRNEEHYPPRDANWTTFHLSDGEKLAAKAGGAGQIPLMPTPLAGSGQNSPFRDQPGYKADFTSPVFTNVTLLSGLPKVHVTVTPTGPGGYITAYLYDVDEGGKETRIGWTEMNLLYASGGDEPKPVVPGMPIVAKLEIEPMDALLPAGHRLKLRLWQNTYADHIPSAQPAPILLNYGGTSRSVVELPIVARAEEAFFEPPRPAT